MAGSLIRRHIFRNRKRSWFHRSICHHKPYCSRRTRHKPKGFSNRYSESFIQCLSCTGWIGKFQMSALADIEFTCIFIRKFQSHRYGMTHIRDISSPKNNIISMATPSLGIPRQFYGKNLCVGCFHRIIDSSDLSCSTCTGTEQSQTVILHSYVHSLQQSIINPWNHKPDCIQNCGSYKFTPRTVCTYTVYIYHSKSSPVLFPYLLC